MRLPLGDWEVEDSPRQVLHVGIVCRASDIRFTQDLINLGSICDWGCPTVQDREVDHNDTSNYLHKHVLQILFCLYIAVIL